MSGNNQQHVRVAIVGAGPAGLGAAIGLAKRHIDDFVAVFYQCKNLNFKF